MIDTFNLMWFYIDMAPYRSPVRAAARAQWGDRSRFGRARTPTFRIPLDVEALGMQLRAEYRRATGTISTIGHYVYAGMTHGEVSYIGITNDPAARQFEHGDRHHIRVLNRHRPLTRIEVRAIEQYVIDLTRYSARNQNIANSIAAHHPYFATARRFGQAFFDWVRREYRCDLRLAL